MKEVIKGHNRQIAIFGTFSPWKGFYKAPCEELAEKLEIQNWKVIRSSNKQSKIFRLFDMISTVLKDRHKFQLGVVEVYSGNAFIWAEAICFILKFLKKPVVLTLHGGNLPNFSKKWPGRVKRLLRSPSKITTPSNYLWDQMKIFRDDIMIIPNSINISAYPFRIRKDVKKNLVWLRNFRHIYNPTLAPRMLSLLLKIKTNSYLTMIGPDSGDGSLYETKEIAKSLGIADKIKFRGGVKKEHIPITLEPYDVFINTTNFDNTPVSIIEAMACGLCIVSTDVGGLPYLLEHEKDAILIPPNNASAMAQAVYRILTEPGLSEKLSRNARAKAERFSWHQILPIWESLFAEIMDQEKMNMRPS